MKLQEAYASEQDKIGTWADIGYKSPAGKSESASTTNFTYAPGTTAGTDDWSATSLVGLNDCTKGSVWKVGASYASSSGNVTFTAAGPGDGCDELTPNFGKIGKVAE